MSTCLICKRDVTGEEDYCATRREDGGHVCPECLAKVRAGSRDALDKLSESRPVHIS